jgi:hypothetical protein
MTVREYTKEFNKVNIKSGHIRIHLKELSGM